MGFFRPAADWILDHVGWPAQWARHWPAGIIGALIVLALTWGVGWFLVNIALRALHRFSERTASKLDDQILAIVEKPMRRMVRIIGLYLAVGQLPFPDGVELVVTGVLLILAIYMGVRVATQVTMVLILAFGKRLGDGASQAQFEKDYIPLLSKIVGTALALFGIAAILHHFGQNVASVVAALGVGGVAVGFAANQTLGNMIAGFTILVDRPFRPGDRIKLASGEVGDVIEVGTRSTRLKMPDHNMLVVPNSDLTNNRIINFNFPNHATRASVDVHVAYGTDVDAAKKLIMAIIEAQPEILKDPGPSCLLGGFADHGLLLTTGYTISDFADVGKVQDRVRMKIYEAFRANAIKVPYPTREVIHANRPPA
jgi:small-conductance mechanosensitive channel